MKGLCVQFVDAYAQLYFCQEFDFVAKLNQDFKNVNTVQRRISAIITFCLEWMINFISFLATFDIDSFSFPFRYDFPKDCSPHCSCTIFNFSCNKIAQKTWGTFQREGFKKINKLIFGVTNLHVHISPLLCRTKIDSWV